ncbi:hypothetical protein BKI52_12070 [marine bacterium AO1-C]|nr:hypothetical protein BKI52_12070 [marine bacterium AO1-C]
MLADYIKIIVLTLCLWAGTSTIGWAQTPEIDSLERRALNLQEDTSAVLILNRLTWKLRDINLNKALRYGKRSLVITQKLQYQKKYSEILSFLGIIYRNMGDYGSAFEYYHRALKIAEKNNQTIQQAYAHNNIGEIFKFQKRYPEAEKHMKNAIAMFVKINNKRGEAYGYLRLGEALQDQKKYNAALEAFFTTKKIRESMPNKPSIDVPLNRIGVVYSKQSKFKEALDYLNQALEINVKDNNLRAISGMQNDIAQVYLMQKKYTKAIEYAKKGLEGATPINAKPIMQKSTQVLNEAFAGLQNYPRAYQYQKQFRALTQQLLNEENARRIQALQSNYQVEKKQAELDLKNKENELLKKDKAENQLRQELVYALIGGLGLTFILILVLIRNNRQKQKNNSLLQIKNQEIAIKNEKLVASEQKERKQAQKLQAANNHLQEAQEQLTASLQKEQKSREELENAHDALKNTQSQMIQSEKMAALGQLIAGIAHEINTPLGAIRSSIESVSSALKDTLLKFPQLTQELTTEEFDIFMQLLENSFVQTTVLSLKEKKALRRALSDKLKEAGIEDVRKASDVLVHLRAHENYEKFLVLLTHTQSGLILNTANKLSNILRGTHNIELATQKAHKIIFALKNYAHRSPEEAKVEGNVKDGIETVLTLYHNHLKQGIHLEREYDEQVPNIWCYPDELNQVWTNLLHNALQAMDFKGDLKVSIHVKDQKLLVGITDSGTGIPDDVIGKIFDPFFTTKPAGEGSGLGLDIVRKIVQKHGGDIEVESTVNVGTTFTVWLPLETTLETQEVIS